MTDDMTVAEAAEVLGTSPQTVRTLLRSGELGGRRLLQGSGRPWVVSRKGVDAFLSQHGRLGGRRRPRSRIARLENTVEFLQQQLAGSAVPSASTHVVAQERDELRARVIALEE